MLGTERGRSMKSFRFSLTPRNASGDMQQRHQAHAPVRHVRHQHHSGQADAASGKRGAAARPVLGEAAADVVRHPADAFRLLGRKFGHHVKRQFGEDAAHALHQAAVQVVRAGGERDFDLRGQALRSADGDAPARRPALACSHNSSACNANAVETGLTKGSQCPPLRPNAKPPSIRGSALSCLEVGQLRGFPFARLIDRAAPPRPAGVDARRAAIARTRRTRSNSGAISRSNAATRRMPSR